MTQATAKRRPTNKRPRGQGQNRVTTPEKKKAQTAAEPVDGDASLFEPSDTSVDSAYKRQLQSYQNPVDTSHFADVLAAAKRLQGSHAKQAGNDVDSAEVGASENRIGQAPEADAEELGSIVESWTKGIHPRVNSVWRVALVEMRESQVNPRWAYIEEEQEALKTSLLSEGQQVPLQAYFDSESERPFVVLDGNGRREAASQLGWADMLVSIVEKPASLTKELRAIREINQNRRKYTLLDEYRAARQLREMHKPKEQRDLARLMGISEERMSEVLILENLPRSVLDTLAAFPAAASSIKVLRNTKKMLKESDDSEPSETLVDYVQKEIGRVGRAEISVNDFERRAKRKADKPVTRKRTLKLVEVKNNGKGGMRHYEDGRILLDVRDVPQGKRLQLWGDLEAVLAKHCTIHSPDVDFAKSSDQPE